MQCSIQVNAFGYSYSCSCQITWSNSTLNTVSSVAYCLELRKAISIYYRSHILPNKCQSGCSDIIEYEQLYLVKNYINSKKI